MDVNTGSGPQWPENNQKYQDIRVIDASLARKVHEARDREWNEERRAAGGLKGKVGRVFGGNTGASGGGGGAPANGRSSGGRRTVMVV